MYGSQMSYEKMVETAQSSAGREEGRESVEERREKGAAQRASTDRPTRPK